MGFVISAQAWQKLLRLVVEGWPVVLLGSLLVLLRPGLRVLLEALLVKERKGLSIVSSEPMPPASTSASPSGKKQKLFATRQQWERFKAQVKCSSRPQRPRSRQRSPRG